MRAPAAYAAGLFAAGGVGAALFVFLGGEPCKSSAVIEWLYVAPLLLGAASFLYVTKAGRRWWLGLASGAAITVASGGLFILIALVQYGHDGCYT